MAWYRLDRERGRRRRVPAATAAAHARKLLDAGWAVAQIERETGVDRHTIRDIAEGRQEWMRPDSETQLLALPIGPPPTQRDIDGTGTRRRIQALVAIGYTLASLAPEVGISQYALARIARGEQVAVRSVTAASVARVYRTRVKAAGPSKRARSMAVARGWHGPLAWDEDTIDDPDAAPETWDADGGEPLEGVRYVADEIRHLDAFGLSDEEIARKLGRSVAYVGQVRRAHLHRAA